MTSSSANIISQSHEIAPVAFDTDVKHNTIAINHPNPALKAEGMAKDASLDLGRGRAFKRKTGNQRSGPNIFFSIDFFWNIRILIKIIKFNQQITITTNTNKPILKLNATHFSID